MENLSINMVDRSKFFKKGIIPPTKDLFIEDDLLNGDEVKYFWTKDPVYLTQYTENIDDLIEKETGIIDSYKTIFNSLVNSMFFVGAVGKEFIGGSRVSVSNPYTENSLPSESDDFNYKSLFPNLDLENNRYCEISKFAIKEEHRANFHHYKIFFKELCSLIYNLDIKYLFFYSTPARTRLYKRLVGEYFIEVGSNLCDFSNWEGFEELPDGDKVSVIAYERKTNI